jgi:autotransporter-associated beta strand protein
MFMNTTSSSPAPSLRTARRIPAHLVATLALAMVGLDQASAQSFTSNSANGTWDTARWNNSADAAPYTSAYTANNTVSFTSGNYTFSGMGSTTNVGNVTVAAGVSVTFSSANSTYATGGLVRTIDVGSNGLFDLNGNAVSTAAGTGLIKSGAGVFGTGAGTFTGGFTLNAGTVVARGTTGLGSGAANTLTLNGGTLASNASRSFDTTRFGGGIVIGGNVQFGERASIVSIASDSANLSFANNVSLGAETRVFTIGNNGTNTFSGNITGSAGSGLTINANSGTTGSIVLSGTANTYSGNTTISAGRLTMASNLIPNSPTIFIGNGATLNATSNFTLSSGQSIVGTGATGSFIGNTNPGLTMNGNNTVSNNAGGQLTLTRLSVLGSNNTITAGNIQSGGSGSGQRGLNIANGNAGTLTISGGSLTTNGNATLGDIIGSTSAAGVGTLNIAGGNYVANSSQGLNIGFSAGSGTLNISSGNVTLPMLTFNAVNGFSNAIVNLDGGTLTLGNLTVTSGNANQFNFNGGTLVASGSLSLATGTSNATSYNVKDGGANINTNGNSVTISNPLLRFAGNSTGGLTKTGLGALTLSGNNTYTGGASVTGGTLNIGLSNAPSGPGTVSSGPIGTGNLTLGDGTSLGASGGGQSLYLPRLNINGNVTIAGTNRLTLLSTVDLGGGNRTINLTKVGTSYASGQEALRIDGNATFQSASGNASTIQNGAITFATITGNATNPAIVRSAATTNFANNLSMTIDDGVAYSSGTSNAFATGANAPALTLNAAAGKGGGILQMGDGSNGVSATMRNAEVFSLAGGGTVSASNTTNATSTGTLTINNGNGADFSGTITEAGGTGIIAVTKSGNGTQTFSGNNSYSGLTTVSAGTLRLGHANALGSTTGNTTVSSGGILDLNGQTIGAEAVVLSGNGTTGVGALINSGSAASLGGAVTLNANTVIGAGNITLSGGVGQSGTRSLTKVGTGTLVLSGNSTYAGRTTLSEGNIDITGTLASTAVTISGGPSAPSTSVFKLSNTNALSSGTVLSGSSSGNGTGTLDLAAGGDYTLGSYGSVSDTGHSMKFTASSGNATSLTFTGNSTVTSGGSGGRTLTNTDANLSIVFGGNLDISSTSNESVTISGAGNTTVNGSVFNNASGIRGLEKTGSGTLTLNGDNSYDGISDFRGSGRVLINGNTTASTGAVNVSSTATLGGSGIVGGAVTLSSNASIGSAGDTLTLASDLTSTGTNTVVASSTVNVLGTTAVTSGTLTVNGALGINGAITGSGTLLVSSTGSVTGNATFSNAATVSGGTLGSSGNTLNFGSTLAVTAATTISSDVIVNVDGTTTVSSGLFAVDGTLGGAGAKTIGTGATLTGGGSLTGDITVQNGGFLAPGNSPGSLVVGDNLYIAGTVLIELGGTAFTLNGTEDYDRIKLTSNSAALTVGGTLSLSLVNSFSLAENQAFGLFQLESGATRSGTFTGLGTDGSLVGNFGGIDLFITYSGDFGDSGTVSTFGGNDIVLYTVPEPGAALLGGLGLLALLRRRRIPV